MYVVLLRAGAGFSCCRRKDIVGRRSVVGCLSCITRYVGSGVSPRNAVEWSKVEQGGVSPPLASKGSCEETVEPKEQCEEAAEQDDPLVILVE